MANLKNLIDKLGTYNPGGSSLHAGWSYHNLPSWVTEKVGELSALSVHRGETEPRFSVILNEHGADWFKGKKIVDIGCNIGGFLFGFAQLGAKCIGYDYDENSIKFAEALAKRLDLPIRFKHSIISPAYVRDIPKADVIIYLDTWMWQVKQYGIEMAKEILWELSKKCDVLYFSSASSQNSMARIPNTTQRTIHNWLLRNTAFQQIEKIYESTVCPWNGRYLYKCSKPKFEYNGWVSKIFRSSRKIMHKVFVNRYYKEFDLYQRHLGFLMELDKRGFAISPQVLGYADGTIDMSYEGILAPSISNTNLENIANALDTCNIKHRDITPENLVWDGEYVKLIDYDWAMWTNEKEWPRPSHDPRYRVYQFIGEDADNRESLKRCKVYLDKQKQWINSEV